MDLFSTPCLIPSTKWTNQLIWTIQPFSLQISIWSRRWRCASSSLRPTVSASRIYSMSSLLVSWGMPEWPGQETPQFSDSSLVVYQYSLGLYDFKSSSVQQERLCDSLLLLLCEHEQSGGVYNKIFLIFCFQIANNKQLLFEIKEKTQESYRSSTSWRKGWWAGWCGASGPGKPSHTHPETQIQEV